MIISEKQIRLLMSLCLEYQAFLALIEARANKQLGILNLIGEITNQQSEELKVIE